MPLAGGSSVGGLVSEDLTAITFVGPATAAVLERSGIEPTDIDERRVSHAELIETGVNPGVAAKIRREHSLPWSLEGGEDLDRRAVQVRGLQEGEREWVAASADGWDDEKPMTDRSEIDDDSSDTWERRPWPSQPDVDTDFKAEAEWRERSVPRPVSSLEAVDVEAESALAEAGITSVRRLATCDPAEVAGPLDVDEETVRGWREAARSRE